MQNEGKPRRRGFMDVHYNATPHTMGIKDETERSVVDGCQPELTSALKRIRIDDYHNGDLASGVGKPSFHLFLQHRSVKQTENALILFDVAAIFAVVTWNADRLHQRAILAPDTGADDCGSRWQLAGASKFGKLDTHAVERPIKLGDVAPTAIVSSDRKDAEHIGSSAIGGT